MRTKNRGLDHGLLRHHLLWGGVIVLLIVSGLLSLDRIYFAKGGTKDGAGAMIGVGAGALILGITSHKASPGFDVNTLDVGSVALENYSHFSFRVTLQSDGDVVTIPIWMVAMIPLIFWMIAWYYFRTFNH